MSTLLIDEPAFVLSRAYGGADTGTVYWFNGSIGGCKLTRAEAVKLALAILARETQD